MTVVKICGITRPDDARAAVAAGADWLGLNFWPPSKRCITGERGRDIAAAARAAASERGRPVVLCGVFVNQAGDDIAALASAVGLDRVQLHGDESPDDCAALARLVARPGAALAVAVVKALALAGPEDVARLTRFACDTFLFDTPTAGYGGSGRVFDWSLARQAVLAAGQRGAVVFLAGGLHAGNVAAAIAQVRPHGVDVASGVESAPGVKDSERMRAFVDAVRSEDEAARSGDESSAEQG